ncbi:MAG: hypothetical protein JO270_12145 [Acidobacteriaceae bacterium]|nr:hypothetical protein [Acidobacteriaceae bacterium]MBV8571546.1 hypothetical protein [Acidobacteriaceae bacterium]
MSFLKGGPERNAGSMLIAIRGEEMHDESDEARAANTSICRRACVYLCSMRRLPPATPHGKCAASSIAGE